MCHSLTITSALYHLHAFLIQRCRRHLVLIGIPVFILTQPAASTNKRLVRVGAVTCATVELSILCSRSDRRTTYHLRSNQVVPDEGNMLARHLD